MSNILLMMKDKVVMEFNFDTLLFNVIDESLLPFTLQGKIKDISDVENTLTRYDITQLTLTISRNKDAITSFLSRRVLPITRSNAKKIYNAFGFSQSQDELSKAKIALICRALSLQDNYWLKAEGDEVSWDEVCLRNVRLSEAIAQVSLHGSSISLTNKSNDALRTPELTGQGAYAKAWYREPDGLYLYKIGAPISSKDGEPHLGSWESKIEVMISNLLDNCNVEHLRYQEQTSNGVYVCKCKCMTNDTISILSGNDFYAWCNMRSLDSHKEAIKIDADSIYKMWIVDYLISNGDRHGLNWGFFYDCDTMKILRCHPLYDHNNSFDIAVMNNEDTPYLYDSSMTMKQAAEIAMKHVDFHFYRDFNKDDFLTTRQYNSFMKRAKELGIKIIPKNDISVESAINCMNNN